MGILNRIISSTTLRHYKKRFKSWKKKKGKSTAVYDWELRDARDNAYIRSLLRYELKENSVCIDVGAHRGAFLSQFIEFAPNARHWAFEPIPSFAEELRKKFPSAEIQNCALSETEGLTTFLYIPELPGWSGLKSQPYPIAVKPQNIQITVRRLDNIIPQNQIISFIKIDVEGAELEVLRGAESLIKRCKPIIFFECAKIHHTNYSTTPEEVFDFFKKCGLDIYLMDQTGPLTAKEFISIYESSHNSGYDRNAWGNYLAMPNKK
ncbi:MAG: hypothetical protein HGGPFJEG_01030 [Ignavibacteria bacterium]|nr:hypothetical protein [Ignavibacteria bacterium]